MTRHEKGGKQTGVMMAKESSFRGLGVETKPGRWSGGRIKNVTREAERGIYRRKKRLLVGEQ